MSKLQEMYDGWKNLLVPDKEMYEVIERIAAARINICNTCDFHSDRAIKSTMTKLRFDKHCTECGCTLAAKTRSLTSECPIQKWKAVVKSEE
jgi:hypothetical protein